VLQFFIRFIFYLFILCVCFLMFVIFIFILVLFFITGATKFSEYWCNLLIAARFLCLILHHKPKKAGIWLRQS